MDFQAVVITRVTVMQGLTLAAVVLQVSPPVPADLFEGTALGVAALQLLQPLLQTVGGF